MEDNQEQQPQEDDLTVSYRLDPTAGGAGDHKAALPSIEGYTVSSELSRGGQAVIYLGVHPGTGRRVAIKVLKQTAVTEQERGLMDREVRVLAELDHPNIVSIFDRGHTEDGRPYFIMEYIQGHTFREYVDEVRKRGLSETSLRELLEMVVRICNAVNAAHLRGIVHRDLKPSNVVIDSYNEPHVLDFGLAHGAAAILGGADVQHETTPYPEFLGSLAWASPEQAEGKISRIDTRSDVYALGLMLYYLLTGRLPYSTEGSPEDILSRIAHEVPPSPQQVLKEAAKKEGRAGFQVQARLNAIVMMALQKDRSRRYQNAGELANDLKHCLSGKPVQAFVQDSRRVRRRGLAAGLAAGLLVAIAAMFMAGIKGRSSKGGMPSGLPDKIEDVIRLVWGYKIEHQEVLFEFNPDFYDIARRPDGELAPLPAPHDIHSVHIAGTFNGWRSDDPAWKMVRAGPLNYYLRKELALFDGQPDWSFKFVLNGGTWVSAPEPADNREGVREDPETFNLVLINPRAGGADKLIEIFRWRNEIDEAWKGMGSFLIRDDEGLHFSFRSLPVGVNPSSFEPLEGIPLVSLQMGNLEISDYRPLGKGGRLDRIHLSRVQYRSLHGRILELLEAGTYDEAGREIQQQYASLEGIPAFRIHRELLMDAVRSMKAIHGSPGTLPVQARSFIGHHYLYIPVPMTWDEARSFCEKAGGYLACITSQAEHRWIKRNYTEQALGVSLWLGATDRQQEGNWDWESGEPWSFSSWTGQEPNNMQEAEHCLVMNRDGSWFDESGERRFPFLIEWSR